jgi:WD40 repeat protein
MRQPDKPGHLYFSAGHRMPDNWVRQRVEGGFIVALIFISHSSTDDASARHVADWLTSRGFRTLFLDFDPIRGIPAGRNWEQELYARLRQAAAMVFLSSRASVASPWCFAELALARAMGVRVLPVRIESDARHPLLRDVQAVDLAGEEDAALQRLASSLRLSGLDPATIFDWDPARSPYPGLRSFQADDAAMFFGRENEINELIERLRSLFRSASLALVGPSGSGKSSLVHAGLLPRLSRLPAEWEVLPPVFPGDRPVTALARSLARRLSELVTPVSWRHVEERLRQHPGELSELARDLAEGQGRPRRMVLLVIDQAEELLTLTGDEAREEFIQIMCPAASGTGPLRLLFTLRSEFLSGFLRQPGLADLIRDSTAIGPLERSRMSAVITGPAQRAGLIFQPGLVEQMVEDAQGGDALPLLAYTLRQLCERAGPHASISVADYKASGGVLGALRGQADRLLGDLDRAGLGSVVLPALVKLVTVGDGDEPTRRRLARSGLTPLESQVIDAFRDAHLVISDQADDTPVVTVAHEALLRTWPPLAGAIEAARENLRQRAQLERIALDWDLAGRQSAYTMTGARLALAERWAQANRAELELMPLLKEFIQASVAWDASARQRAANSLAAQANYQLAGDPNLAISLAVAAIDEYGPADQLVETLREALRRSRVRAVLPGEIAVTRVAWAADGRRAATGMADGSVRIWDTLTSRQLLAFDGAGRSVYCLAFSPDQQSVIAGSGRRLNLRSGGETDEHVEEVLALGPSQAVSADGSEVATLTSSGHELRVTTRDGTTLRSINLSSAFQRAREDSYQSSVAWSPDGNHLAIAVEDGGLILDRHNGSISTGLRLGGPVPTAVGHRLPITSVSFSADGRRIATLFRDGVPRVWDTSDGRLLLELRDHPAAMTFLAFAPRGSRLLAGADDGTALIWNIADDYDVLPGADGLLYELQGHSGPVTGVDYSPDGTRIVTSSRDGTARLWEAETGSGRLVRVLHGHQAAVTATAFSPDGSLIVTAAEDGTMRFWPADGDGQARVVNGPPNVGRAAGAPPRFTSVTFSPDGALVAAGLWDSTVRVWQTSNGEQRSAQNIRGRVTSVAFSPDGSSIAGSAWNSDVASAWTGAVTVPIWQVATKAITHQLDHRATVFSVGFSPDGTRLATAGADGGARIWDIQSNAELLTARDYGAIVRCVSFSADGTRLLTAADDATGRVWDASDGRERFVFAGHSGPVLRAVFSPEGGQVATASADCTIRVWRETGVGELLRTAHRRGARQLPPADRLRFNLPVRESGGAPLTRAADLSTAEANRKDSDGSLRNSAALIAERAQAIARSPQAGSDEENWLLAEQQLRSEGILT